MYKFNYNQIKLFIIMSLIALSSAQQNTKNQNSEDTFEHDLTDTFKIEESTNGVQKVNLKCGSDSMFVQLETEKDFSGVMYTRGSFNKQAEPCFTKPKNGRSRSLEMQFSFNQCQTVQDGDVFSNIVVIQNDPELVTPGDSAFSLECDFRKSRSIEVGADMQARERTIFSSRITLTSPDPSAPKPHESDNPETAFNESDTVTFIPIQKSDGFTIRTQRIEGSVEEVQITEQPFQQTITTERYQQVQNR